MEPAANGGPNTRSGVSFHHRKATFIALYTRPMPKPVKIVLALIAWPPSLAISAFALSDAASYDSRDAPAFSTSAHAVPSGYLSVPRSEEHTSELQSPYV